VDIVYELAGGTSIYAKHPLQRQFRDLHVIIQHVVVSSTSTTLTGRGRSRCRPTRPCC